MHVTQIIVSVLLVGMIRCGNSKPSDAADSSMDGEGDCTPIAAPGPERRCPEGCNALTAVQLIFDAAGGCTRSVQSSAQQSIIAGCEVPGEYKRASVITCYYRPEGGQSLIIRMPATYPELLSQGWSACGDDLSPAPECNK
jgi:hypothetical protein